MLRLAVLTVVLSTLLVGSAHAAVPKGAGPADGQFWEEVKIAQEYWAVRGYRSCDLVIPSIAPIPPNPAWSAEEVEVAAIAVVGWSVVGSCKVQLVPSFAELTRVDTDYFELRHECAIVVHEVGHALGLQHEDADRFPLMGQDRPHDQFDEVTIPGRCGAWARRIVRERRAQLARARRRAARARRRAVRAARPSRPGARPGRPHMTGPRCSSPS